MKRFLSLDRPLAVFDIESTGLNPHTDRIVELSVLRLEPDGSRTKRTWRLNPTVPIPAETTAIHGITDEMVASAPTFAEKAQEILDFFKGCDIGGFGLSKLDIPLIEEEFARCSMHFDSYGRRLFDALRVYHAREPRDLAAAMRFYCGEEHSCAHGAEADAEAALRVLEGEFEKYGDLPEDPDAFDRLFNTRDPAFLDREGRFKTVDGVATVNFGKKKGQKLDEIAMHDPSFLKWIVKGDFASDTKRIASEALERCQKRRADPAKPRVAEKHRNDAKRRGADTVPAGFEGFAAALEAALGSQPKQNKQGEAK
ncbi:MAG: 3'-5' exonuclease [Kiritimatiellae bacterium]|nr:3'-5' exonuclease [Kiritimatiellia bacterium]